MNSFTLLNTRHYEMSNSKKQDLIWSLMRITFDL